MCPQSAHMETTHMRQLLLFFSFHFSLLLFLFVPPRFPKVNKLSDIYHHRTQAYNIIIHWATNSNGKGQKKPHFSYLKIKSVHDSMGWKAKGALYISLLLLEHMVDQNPSWIFVKSLFHRYTIHWLVPLHFI